MKFGAIYTRRLKRKHRGYGDTFFIDEVFAGVPDHKINGKQHYLWRAVDQDGVAHRELMPTVIHDNAQYANNRAEQSHKPTRVRERVMRGATFRRFKSVRQAQRFLGAHAACFEKAGAEIKKLHKTITLS